MTADPKGIFSRQIAESSVKERKARGERPRKEAPNIFIWFEGLIAETDSMRETKRQDRNLYV